MDQSKKTNKQKKIWVYLFSMENVHVKFQGPTKIHVQDIWGLADLVKLPQKGTWLC